MKKYDLAQIIVEALKKNGGSGTIIEVSKYTWENYKNELEESGDLFYTWQYDIRWAATELRKSKVLKDKTVSPRGLWELI